MVRSLSPLESKLILHLEWGKKTTVSIQEAMEILGCSYNHARQLLYRLNERQWLARIKSGSYELIPAERGEYAFPDTNPLFIGSKLITPYYFSFATAAFFHGLSTQASATVYLATTKRKGRRVLTVRGKSYRFVLQPDYKFFGAVEKDAFGSQVMIADPEKTVVDSLDQPAYSGDLPEIAGMLTRGREKLNWKKLVEYALRFEIQALIQRLGYLADLLELPLETILRESLLDRIGASTPYLGRSSQWGTGGEYDAVWHIVDNVPRQELLSEIRIW